jgi:hypothetical protein
VAGSCVLRFWAGHRLDVPWISPDETVYAVLGRSLWEDGSPSIFGASSWGYSVLYPALIGLPLSLGGVGAGVTAAQLMGAVLMSAAAVVVYLWGRRLVEPRWALLAAALTLALPELAYSGLLMSEVLQYPITLLALAAIAAALARPTPGRQALVVVAIVAALAAHLQAVALIPALAVATALQAGFERSFAPLRRQAPLLAGLALLATVAVGAFALRGGWRGVFGAYAAATGGYDAAVAAESVVWHLAGVFILVAGIPLVALAAMLVECASGRERDPRAGALVATASAWTACVVLEVGTFASRWAEDHLLLRDLLPVVPPLMLVFALWIARGLPRPAPVLQLAAFLLAVPAVLLPVARFATQEAALDAFSLIPLWRFRDVTSDSMLEIGYAVAVAVLVAAAVFVPRRFRLALPLLVAVVLVGMSVVASRAIDRLTAAERAWVFDSGSAGWVDEAADAPALFLQAGTAHSATFWKHAFWNRRLAQVAYLPDAAPVPPARATEVELSAAGDLRTRSGRPVRARYLVAPSDLELVGMRAAEAPRSTDLTGLTLWRLDGPARVRWWTAGVQPNGDIVGEARMTVFACGRGQLELTLLGKQGLPVEIRADGILYKRVAVRAGQVWQGAVDAPPGADGRGSCVFTITSPGLVGSTRLEFVGATARR